MRENKGHVPTRTCISCGAKRSKKELIRLILDAQGLLVRDDGKQQGRGAYVCPDRGCWDGLKKAKHLGSAFRRDGHIAFHPDLRFK